MKKLLLICPILAVLIFAGAMCTVEDTDTVTVTNTTETNTAIEEPSIELDATDYGVGADVTVTVYAADLLVDTAWIGIIPSDVEHGDVELNDEYDLDYAYVGGGESKVVRVLTAPDIAGDYDVRLNSADNVEGAEELDYVSFTVN